MAAGTGARFPHALAKADRSQFIYSMQCHARATVENHQSYSPGSTLCKAAKNSVAPCARCSSLENNYVPHQLAFNNWGSLLREKVRAGREPGSRADHFPSLVKCNIKLSTDDGCANDSRAGHLSQVMSASCDVLHLDIYRAC